VKLIGGSTNLHTWLLGHGETQRRGRRYGEGNWPEMEVAGTDVGGCARLLVAGGDEIKQWDGDGVLGRRRQARRGSFGLMVVLRVGRRHDKRWEWFLAGSPELRWTDGEELLVWVGIAIAAVVGAQEGAGLWWLFTRRRLGEESEWQLVVLDVVVAGVPKKKGGGDGGLTQRRRRRMYMSAGKITKGIRV
jgi:hypothetical protein